MSLKWMTKVWDEALAVQGTPLVVLLCIADHAQDDTGEAWPSIARIAHRTRRSERAVFKALGVIEEAGWIERINRPGHSTVYRMLDPLTPDATFTPARSSPLTPASPTPDATFTPPLTPRSPITTNEPPMNDDPSVVDGDGATTQEVTNPHSVGGAAAVSHSVTPPATVPVVLQRKLRDMGVNDGTAWTSAWQTATSVVWPDFAAFEAEHFPEEHLMLHLLQQQDRGQAISPSRWLRFFLEDRQRRIAVIAGQIEQEARMSETPQEREDRLNRRLPPIWPDEPRPAATTGEKS